MKRKESWSCRIDIIIRYSKLRRNIENSLKESLKCKVLFIRIEELFLLPFLFTGQELLYTNTFFAYRCTRKIYLFSFL